MIYFIVTCSLYDECHIRKTQYTNAIRQLQIVTANIPNLQIIVVENNGNRPTMLDKFGCDVLYTNNNQMPTRNKGNKELKDVRDCMNAYHIQDDDFVVKMTGRYILTDSSEFIEKLKHLDPCDECIIKYGSYLNPANEKMEDCITGLIGMRAKYIQHIQWSTEPEYNGCIEWDWARATYLIPDENIYKVGSLGIYICPGNNTYFLV
jgi:hypothetical protein